MPADCVDLAADVDCGMQDDSVEQPVATLCERLGIDVQVLELPNEGTGLTAEHLAQVTELLLFLYDWRD